MFDNKTKFAATSSGSFFKLCDHQRTFKRPMCKNLNNTVIPCESRDFRDEFVNNTAKARLKIANDVRFELMSVNIAGLQIEDIFNDHRINITEFSTFDANCIRIDLRKIEVIEPGPQNGLSIKFRVQ